MKNEFKLPKTDSELILLTRQILRMATEYIKAGYFKSNISGIVTYAEKILTEINTEEK